MHVQTFVNVHNLIIHMYANIIIFTERSFSIINFKGNIIILYFPTGISATVVKMAKNSVHNHTGYDNPIISITSTRGKKPV